MIDRADPDDADQGRTGDPGEAEGSADAATLAVEQFERLFADGNIDTFLELVERYFAGEITGRTYVEFQNAALTLVGIEATSMLASLAQDSTAVRQVLSESPLSDAARAMLLRLLTLYGPQIELAVNISDGPWSRPDDWRSLFTQATRDVASGRYSGTLTFVKLNGETMTIRGSGGSMMRLANLMVEHLVTFGDPEAFPDLDKQRFEELSARLRAMLDGNTEL